MTLVIINHGLLTHWGCPMSNWLYNFVQLIDVGGVLCFDYSRHCLINHLTWLIIRFIEGELFFNE